MCHQKSRILRQVGFWGKYGCKVKNPKTGVLVFKNDGFVSSSTYFLPYHLDCNDTRYGITLSTMLGSEVIN